MPYIEWTEDMGEISGFGGSYEAGCRAMVKAGVEYWERREAELAAGNAGAGLKPFDPHYRAYEGVVGIAEDMNEDARALDEAMMAAEVEMNGKVVRCGDEATGAMHQAAISHIFAFRRLGADEYRRVLRERGAPKEGA